MRNHQITKLQGRQPVGSSLLELPLFLAILFFLFFFPLIDLAVIGLRSSMVTTAANQAALKAARAEQYSENSANGQLSARATATRWARDSVRAGYGGVTIREADVRTFIVGMPLRDGLPPIRQEAPLQEVNKDDYIYQIEVEVAGTVEPLLMLNDQVIGQVPGLSAPLTIRVSSREFFEHTKGLTK